MNAESNTNMKEVQHMEQNEYVLCTKCQDSVELSHVDGATGRCPFCLMVPCMECGDEEGISPITNECRNHPQFLLCHCGAVFPLIGDTFDPGYPDTREEPGEPACVMCPSCSEAGAYEDMSERCAEYGCPFEPIPLATLIKQAWVGHQKKMQAALRQFAVATNERTPPEEAEKLTRRALMDAGRRALVEGMPLERQAAEAFRTALNHYLHVRPTLILAVNGKIALDEVKEVAQRRKRNLESLAMPEYEVTRMVRLRSRVHAPYHREAVRTMDVTKPDEWKDIGVEVRRIERAEDGKVKLVPMLDDYTQELNQNKPTKE